MANLTNRNCPLSEDFFYWPPEEISRYKDWCEVTKTEDSRVIPKEVKEDKVNKLNI